MMLEKGKIYELDVAPELVTVDDKKYFQVKYGESGGKYLVGVLPFQLKEEFPKKLRCLVKDVTSEGSFIITQDFSPHIARFYNEGNTYTFKVKQIWNEGIKTCFYVYDEYGFSFPVETEYTRDIHMYQDVQCRVEKLYKNYLQLSLVKGGQVEADGEFELEELLRQLLTSVLPEEWRERIDSFEDLFYMPDLPEFEEELFRWIDKMGDEDIESHIGQIDAFNKNCLDMLEDSTMLREMDYSAMVEMQTKLSICVEISSYIYQGKQLINQGEHEKYVSQLLEKLAKSRYIYHPEEKLGILRTVLRCTKGEMLPHVQKLVDILSNGTMNYWSNEPIRSSLVKLLDDQIRNHREAADYTATNGNGVISLILSLIVMEICLVEHTDSWESDMVDKRKLYSMLYRYLSYMDNAPVGVLASKSLSCLIDGAPSKGQVAWSDMSNLEILAQKMANHSAASDNNVSPSMMCYRADHAQIRVGYNGVEIVSVAGKESCMPVLPDNLLSWQRQQIYLSEKVKGVSTLKNNLLNNYKKFWDALQNSLLSEKKVEKKQKNKMPVDKGEEVLIRISGYLNEHNMFPCTVEQDDLCGHGFIAPTEIVDWNVYDFTTAFLDDEGNPLLFKAKVASIDDEGNCYFTMKKNVKNYICEQMSYGNEVVMLVKSIKDGGYQGLSEYGCPLHFDVTDNDVVDSEINVGDYVLVFVEDVNSNRSNITCSFMRHEMDQNWTEDYAFANLMLNYADSSLVYEDEEETEVLDVESQLKPSYIMELMLLEDRLSSFGESQVAYSYLGMARVMAALLSNDTLVEYYTQRMELLKMLHEFSVNGKVETEQIESFKKTGAPALSKDSQLWFRYNQLLIISYMGVKDHNMDLWNYVQDPESSVLSQLASLVLSYNLIGGFNIERTRAQIKEKIYGILNLKTVETIHRQYAAESQTVEHKTSLIFPPDNNMRVDLDTQANNIMKEVSAFMNAQGGTLYIGVNNEGTATGIENDLKTMFSNDKDKYNVYFRNQVKDLLGMEANSLIETSFDEDDLDIVYVVKVSPSERVITLKGKVYQRIDTSSEPLSGSYLKRFLKSKGCPNLLSQIEENVSVATESVSQESKPNVAKIEEPQVGIETNQLRNNVLVSWEDNFHEAVRYITILPDGKYRLEEEVYGNDGLITLAIHEEEKNGFLVLAYKDGSVNAVPLHEILEKKIREELRMCEGDLYFAGIAQKGDRLFSMIKGNNEMYYYRVDELKDLCQGKITDTGKMLSNLSEYEFIQADILPASMTSLPDSKAKRDMGTGVTKAQGLELKRMLTAAGYTIKEVM